MPLIQTAQPAIEPVLPADVRLFCRIDSTAEDTLLTLLISAARRYAEMYTARSFVTQGWRLVLDSFPGPSQVGVPYGVPYSLPGHAILLERSPLQTLASVKYTAMDGSLQTMPATDYVVDASGALPRITPVFGKIWPIPLPQIGAVQVDYTAGYGPAATDVPEGLRHWIMLRAATLYENREEVAILNRGKVEPLPFVDGLLDPYRVVLP